MCLNISLSSAELCSSARSLPRRLPARAVRVGALGRRPLLLVVRLPKEGGGLLGVEARILELEEARQLLKGLGCTFIEWDMEVEFKGLT